MGGPVPRTPPQPETVMMSQNGLTPVQVEAVPYDVDRARVALSLQDDILNQATPIYQLVRFFLESAGGLMAMAFSQDMSSGHLDSIAAMANSIAKEAKVMKTATSPAPVDNLITSGSQRTILNAEFFQTNRRIFASGQLEGMSKRMASELFMRTQRENERLRGKKEKPKPKPKAETKSYGQNRPHPYSNPR